MERQREENREGQNETRQGETACRCFRQAANKNGLVFHVTRFRIVFLYCFDARLCLASDCLFAVPFCFYYYYD